MKNFKVLIGLMAFIVVAATNVNAKPFEQSATVKDSIHVWTDLELSEIAETWANAYEKLNPETKINVSTTSLNNVANMIEKSRNIGLVTKNNLPETNSKSIWKMAVGRDIIVPVMNPKNPLFKEIQTKGISPEEFINAFSSKQNQTWGNLLGVDQSTPINYYYIEKKEDKALITDFLQTGLSEIGGTNMNDLNEFFGKIQNDKNALAFCRLIDLQNFEAQKTENLISLIPIDLNGNDKIDFIENIYNNSNSLERGVWIGKYPKVLYSNMYTIAKNQPIESAELAFLEWIITDGQQYLNTDGFSELLVSERQRKVEALHYNPTSIIETQIPVNRTTSTIIIVLVISILLITPIVIMFFKSKNPIIEDEKIITYNVFAESSVIAPNGVFFDKSHTWAFMERDGYVKIGVADFLQHATGIITNIKTKDAGDSVKKGEPFLTLIQHGKQLNIQSPISGKIKEINKQLISDSSLINSSPLSEGWIYTIESNNWLKEITSLFIGETYKNWLKDEFTRLKDFFSTARLDVTNHLQPVIQDGGELNDNPMENYGPEVWEEFQTKFINRAR